MRCPVCQGHNALDAVWCVDCGRQLGQNRRNLGRLLEYGVELLLIVGLCALLQVPQIIFSAALSYYNTLFP